jgi:hypothetical protein
MNIFVLDQDPILAAEAQCDQHVVKMTVETAQLLCAAFDPGVAPYRRTHANHPCSLWTRQTAGNFLWLVEHGMALADEYTYRFNGKTHASREVILWCLNHFDLALFDHSDEVTPFAQAMPDEFRHIDPVAAYRAYYAGSKVRFATWTKGRPAPTWWPAPPKENVHE